MYTSTVTITAGNNFSCKNMTEVPSKRQIEQQDESSKTEYVVLISVGNDRSLKECITKLVGTNIKTKVKMLNPNSTCRNNYKISIGKKA